MWSTTSQTSRVFGWTDRLERWNTGSYPLEVRTVLDNLGSGRSFPSSHFFTYMNEEQDALKWFIFECIASSWQWASAPRLTYIKDAVDLIENLDTTFPVFPGSPLQNQTVRGFLTRNLDEEQLSFIEMMPPLVYSVMRAPVTAPALAPLTRVSASRNPPATVYGVIRFHILRDAKNSSHDDIVTIRKESEETYSYTYTDKTSVAADKTWRHSGLSMSQVMGLLKNMFNLLNIDAEPYHGVQVLLPTSPSVMLRPKDLTSCIRDILYDSVENVMNSWPVAV